MNVKKMNWWMGGAGTTSAFADIWGWWRADTFSGVTPNVILTDKSTNARNMTQAGGTLTAGTAANGKAKFTGNATARLTCAGTIKSWPITQITICRRTAAATCGFFSHTGASPFNTMWAGYESSNRFAVYNFNTTLNTTAEAGTDSCYIARIGYGSRISILNGVVQSDCILSTITQTGLIATELGTQYRGLNMDWQETLVWDRELSMAEIDEVHTYVNLRYGMSIPLFSSYSTSREVIVTGDSMASGRAPRGASDVNVPAEYLGAQTNVKIWWGTITAGMGSSWDQYNLASNNNQLNDQFAGTNTYFGVNVSLGKEYVDRTSNLIHILQSSTGSGSITKLFSNGFFDPFDNSLVHNSQTRLYGNLVKNYWKSFSAFQASGTIPNILGIVIFLGTNDATDSTASNNFSAQAIALVTQLRKELGVTPANSKILFVRMHIGTSGGTFESTIRAQTALAVAAIPNCVMVDDDAYSFVDGVHLNGAGNISLGNDLQLLL